MGEAKAGALVGSLRDGGEVVRDLNDIDDEGFDAGSCAAGGQLLETGRDTSGDGELTDDEVESTVLICNGRAGANGTSESGCSTTGQDQPPLSMFAILATLGLAVVMRRRKQVR